MGLRRRGLQAVFHKCMLTPMNRIRPRTVGLALLILLFVIVVLQNTEIVDIRVLFWKLSMSRIILLVFALVVGLAVGYGLGRKRGRRSEYATLKKK